MKRLRSVRIELPKGNMYKALQTAATLHGAPSLSRYILTAAMTYTTDFLRDHVEKMGGQRDD